MIITPASISALFTGYSRAFQDALTNTPHDWQQVATTVPSTSKSNTYGWLGQFPQFREWIGDRVMKDMQAHGYTIDNKTWESTVAVSRDDIEDDNLGIYSTLFEEMGRAAASHPDELVFPLLSGGLATTCYDGQNFFDTDHPVYPNVDGTGVPENVSNTAGGTGDAWYLLDVSRSLKPLIYQQRRAPNLQPMASLTDEAVFTANEYRFGADMRSNAGYGFWQFAYHSAQPLDPASYAAAREAMMGFKADGGRPLGIRPMLLVVPPSLEGQGLAVLKAERDASGATNVYYNSANLLVTPWL